MFWKKNREASPAPVETPQADKVTDGAKVTSEVAEAHPAAAAPVSAPPTPGAPIETGAIRELVIEQLRNVFDPEIPVNIHELGLVYKIDVADGGDVKIEMTLTSPACPSAAEIPLDVRHKVGSIPGVNSVDVEIVWDPPWTMEFMSEAAKVQLGFF